MDTILWNSDLSVGIRQFDEEHRHLIDLINKLNQALMIGSAPKTMEEILSGLVDYTVIHFKHEEDLMTQYGYPRYDQHRNEHISLTSQVIDFQTRLKEGRASFSLELMHFLSEWLIKHIQMSDKHYKEFFSGKGVS